MPQVYAINPDATSSPIPEVGCKDEERELQLLLENNLDLLPGEQIRPEDPLRWVLIKREMPVPDPNGTGDRWSIDLLLADQEARPTFVECKRYADTRSRREVVGQMLDYAANGRHYWNKQSLWSHAEGIVKAKGADLEAVLGELRPDTSSVEEYFQRMEDNLRAGQVRLVFFMERAPYELRSIVEFLNNQMERSEVLIVEARQFEQDGLRLVVPMLFGYTEQARQVKKVVTVTTTGTKPTLDEGAFFAAVQDRLALDQITPIQKVYDYARSNDDLKISWGSSSLGVSAPRVIKRPKLFNVYVDGRLEFPFGAGADDASEALRRNMVRYVLPHVGATISDDMLTKFPSVKIEVWGPKVDDLIRGLQGLLVESENDEQPSARP